VVACPVQIQELVAAAALGKQVLPEPRPMRELWAAVVQSHRKAHTVSKGEVGHLVEAAAAPLILAVVPQNPALAGRELL